MSYRSAAAGLAPAGIAPQTTDPISFTTATSADGREPHAALACLEWLAECSGRIAELDPSLSIDAADRIAGYLWSNERLRNMPPRGAAEFLFADPQARLAIPAG